MAARMAREIFIGLGPVADKEEQDEPGSREHDLDLAIAEDQDHNIRHEAIDVAESKCPFHSADAATVFSAALEEVKSAGIISVNFGVSETEWEGPFYPEVEMVKVGRKEV
ncbi:hypothetical protein B0H13DRAFT_2306687 [Mycena leptocephala]|nr:hypothetical protein B0H13DRAFT_2306687 [Mycena leptocephala]